MDEKTLKETLNYIQKKKKDTNSDLILAYYFKKTELIPGLKRQLKIQEIEEKKLQEELSEIISKNYLEFDKKLFKETIE